MKRLIRIFAVLAFFTLTLSLNSFAYTVLCQPAPHSGTFTTTFEPMFTCTIPANEVPTNASIRFTINAHTITSGGMNIGIALNGTQVAFTSVPVNQEIAETFTITNTGATTYSIAGTTMAQFQAALGPQSLFHASLSWTSGWTLQIMVAANSGTITATGDTFVVEVLD